MTDPEKELYSEIMIELILFGVSASEPNRVFSPSDHHASTEEHSMDAIIKSGIAEKITPILENPWKQKYQITKTLRECREFFIAHPPSPDYQLDSVIALFSDTTAYMRKEPPLSLSSGPFTISDRDRKIVSLLVHCGYAISISKQLFQWTDRMAQIYFDNGDWGVSTIWERQKVMRELE